MKHQVSAEKLCGVLRAKGVALVPGTDGFMFASREVGGQVVCTPVPESGDVTPAVVESIRRALLLTVDRDVQDQDFYAEFEGVWPTASS